MTKTNVYKSVFIKVFCPIRQVTNKPIKGRFGLEFTLGVQVISAISRLLPIFFLFISMSTLAGNYFPPAYKTFPFKEGDLLVGKGMSGKFSISKVLRIDKIVVKKGESINIQNKSFVATEDDYLLIVSSAYGKEEFNSFEQAKIAASKGTWKVGFAHIPNRAPGAMEGQKLVGHSPVKAGELDGYKLWREAFDKGDAGVF